MASSAAEQDAKPRRLDWLRAPKLDDEGAMSLWDHLREVRYRVTISALAIVLAGAVSIFFRKPLIDLIMAPYMIAKGNVMANNPDALLQLSNAGVTGAFTLTVVVILLSAIIITIPIWMYQVWAFVAPGLLSKEKKYALMFMGTAIPLFLIGCLVGYWVWPRGIAVMLSFTPQDMGIMNLQDMTEFIILEAKIILAFGLSFLLPVVLVTLNVFGVVKGYQLAQARRFVLFGICVFAAIITPSTDPFTMLALFIPMTGLYIVAELIAKSLDKRKGITAETAGEFKIDVDDDEGAEKGAAEG